MNVHNGDIHDIHMIAATRDSSRVAAQESEDQKALLQKLLLLLQPDSAKQTVKTRVTADWVKKGMYFQKLQNA